jgi:Papain family cysteine protease
MRFDFREQRRAGPVREPQTEKPQIPADSVEIRVRAAAAKGGNRFTVDLARLNKLPPLSALCGTRAPKPEDLRQIVAATNKAARLRVAAINKTRAQRAAIVQAAGPDSDLPTPTPDMANFSWVQAGYVSPVKNQGYCGDCWNFAGIGVLESMYAIRFGRQNLLNLSEQQVLENNKLNSGSNWDCCGGWWAFDYMTKGVVGEGRYTAYNVKGCCPTQPPPASDAIPVTPMPSQAVTGRLYRVDHFAYVGDSDAIADPIKIKQALCDHGPVISAVLADEAFQTYSGGTFTGTATQDANGNPINHAVVIVGWTPESWIVKNSWGTEDFGVGGFILMQYGSNNIGYGAAWAEPALSQSSQ